MPLRIMAIVVFATLMVLPTAIAPAIAADAIAAETTGKESLRLVRVQLKWYHQFQSAGLYAAIEQGYFREEGLDVRLLEGQPDVDAVDVVLAGEAEFGIGSSELVIDRSQGKPVVAVAAFFQHSPFILVARRGSDLQSIHDLVGKTVMVEPHAAELLAYLRLERVPIDRIRMVPHTGDLSGLRAGNIDAATAYVTTEPYLLRQHGIEFQIFHPSASGIDFYGDTLFTTEAILKRDRQMVEAFRRAAIKGWRYAMSHPDEIIDLLTTHYRSRMSREALEFEAEQTRRLAVPLLVEAGYMHEGRWRHIANGYAAAGLMPRNFSLEGFIYDPNPEKNLGWLYGTMSGLVIFSLAVSAVLFKFHRMNRALNREISTRKVLEDQLRRLATTDPLTGIANRRHFLEEGRREVMRAHRLGHPLALLMVDIDRFKGINDTWGHATGDRVLTAFADLCQHTVRQIDVIGRLGGEEFAMLLPEATGHHAVTVAERLRTALRSLDVRSDKGEAVRFTVSVGIAVFLPDETLERAMGRADRALYEAKHTGRDRIVICPEYDDTRAPPDGGTGAQQSGPSDGPDAQS